MQHDNIPILIVGGGPVGLGLSMELLISGIFNLLVNKRSQITTHHKGSTINSRTMEHLRRYGVSSSVRKTGLPDDYPTDSTYVSRLNGCELGRIKMPTLQQKLDNPGPWSETALTPEPIHRSNQMYFEAIMLDHAQSFKEVDIRFGWELIFFEDKGDHVEAKIEDASINEIYSIECRYLIGCDGANGIVRRQLGFKYAGRDSTGGRFYDGSMVSIYARSAMVGKIKTMSDSWHY